MLWLIQLCGWVLLQSWDKDNHRVVTGKSLFWYWTQVSVGLEARTRGYEKNRSYSPRAEIGQCSRLEDLGTLQGV